MGKYINIDVDVDVEDVISDITTDDLILELQIRTLDNVQIQKLRKIAKECSEKGPFTSSGVLDDMKLEIMKQGWENKTLTELEQFFK